MSESYITNAIWVKNINKTQLTIFTYVKLGKSKSINWKYIRYFGRAIGKIFTFFLFSVDQDFVTITLNCLSESPMSFTVPVKWLQQFQTSQLKTESVYSGSFQKYPANVASSAFRGSVEGFWTNLNIRVNGIGSLV